MPRPRHRELHRQERVGWLRAAVLGANDGIISTASLLTGIAASHAGRSELLLAGTAGLVAGAMSMAAGEYVSVSSQADTEAADLLRERGELQADPEYEREELAAAYRARGLSEALAREVASELMAHDALGAHARDELGMSSTLAARPLQAAVTSAACFSAGAALPLAIAAVAPLAWSAPAIGGSALVLLVLLGGLAARIGGAPVPRAAARVAILGALAMGLTGLVGTIFGGVVG